MSVAEDIRKDQLAYFDGENVPEDSPLRETTIGIYDACDALDDPRRSLLLDKALMLAQHTMEHVLEHTADHQVRALVMHSMALTAIAGYTLTEAAERQGWTSTGDAAVDQILKDCQAMVKASTEIGMSEEHRELAAKVNAAVTARLKAGEVGITPEQIVAEEIAKAHEESGMPLVAMTSNGMVIARAEDAEDVPDDLKGMYL